MKYTLIRADRKTLSLTVRDGQLTVRAPKNMPLSEINAFIEKKHDWLEQHLHPKTTVAPEEKLSMEDLQALANRALQVIPPRAARYAAMMGVSYSRIVIRNQRTLWGSCSLRTRTLNFNCLLMLTPENVLDAVIIHELCHLDHPGHQKDFYDMVYRFCPEYDKADKWLKENGPRLIHRMIEK